MNCDKEISCVIVDDEKEARTWMEIRLGEFSEMRIIGSEGNPEKAIDLIINKRPEIVFIDVEMPRLNGFEVIKEVRSRNVYPSFIFVTGYNRYARKAIEEGAIDFLIKPVDNEQLKKSIYRYKNDINSDSN